MRALNLLVPSLLLACQLSAQQIPIDDGDALIAWVAESGQQHFSYPVSGEADISEIAEKFGCTPERVMALNRQYSVRTPEQGELIEIPLHPSRIWPDKNVNHRRLPVYYVVRPKETLFSIARRYFNIPIDQIQHLNGIDSTELSIGQRLLLGYIDFRSHLSLAPLTSTTGKDSPTGRDYFDEMTGVKTERGVALWNKEHPDMPHLFVMHRTARINSMLEITNPMFGKALLVKVVGKIPRTFSDDITIVVSPGVARKLGAIDSRFYAHLKYVE